MNRSSLLKIAISLFIIAAYTFLFGIMGTVEGIGASSDDVLLTNTPTVSPEETPAETLGTSQFAPISESYSINVENAAKPHLIDYESFGDVTFSEETATSIEVQETTTPKPDALIEITTGNPAATNAPVITTTKPQTTTPAITTTPAVTTTTEMTTTQPPVTTTQAPVNEEAAKEQLTVYYTGSGGNVTGDAVSIVARATMAEIGGQFDEEAIKAQAVAAYTYIKLYNKSGKAAYIGSREPSDRVINIVKQVIGQAVYYNGSLIQAVYAASTAGYAASSLTVWGVDYPYLRSHVCELDAEYDPYYGSEMTMTSSEIASLIYTNSGIVLDGDPSKWFVINEHVDTVFVGKMTVGGKTKYVNSSGTTVTITGRVLREQLMNFKLKSPCFEVTYDSSTDKFTFKTYGYGHCVGLSQLGANALATYRDYDYKQILEYYYPGTTVK